MAKTDVKSMTLEELQLFMGELGEPKFRAKQIFDWLHQKQVDTFAEMTNLSQKLRERLEQEAKIGGVEMVERLLSKEDGTRKYLFALENGSIIESVLMQYDYGNTVCVSTQAGCRMGCKFCASTLDGVERSLTPAEMLSQVYTIQKDLGQRISGVVLMGSGEPLDNYDNVLRFIHLLNDPAQGRIWDSVISHFPPADSLKRCIVWQRKTYRLPWQFPFMRQTMKFAEKSCLWRKQIPWKNSLEHVWITQTTQNVALHLNMP